MATPNFTPAPAAGVSPPPPLLPDIRAARDAARKVGEAYGRFQADRQEFVDFFTQTGLTGGVAPWNRTSPKEKLELLAKVQRAYAALPPLPPSSSLEMAKAVRDGFREGAKIGFDAARFEYRAVWVACELAKAFAIGKASVPTTYHIGSAAFDKTRDCAARTAARAILELTGLEVESAGLVETFGLPSESIDGYRMAVAYTRSWFQRLGFTVGDLVDFEQAVRSRIAGRYLVFFQGRGHVVYGEITATEVRLIDDQAGRVWRSVMEAQNYLGVKIGGAYRIESYLPPG